jgi:hypothetical protein
LLIKEEEEKKELKSRYNHYTVCNAEQRVVGIEFDGLSDAHNDEEEDDDDELENVGEEFDDESGDDVACGIGIDGDIGVVDVNPSK